MRKAHVGRSGCNCCRPLSFSWSHTSTGHHIAAHGAGDFALSVDGSERVRILAQELEADHLAALIIAHAGFEFRTPFAQSGDAGVVMLVAMDMLRRARDVLETGCEQPFQSNTHPP